MKPNRLILKLVIVAVASTVAGCPGSRGVRTTPFIVNCVGGFDLSARGTSSFALSTRVTSVSHSKLASTRSGKSRASIFGTLGGTQVGTSGEDLAELDATEQRRVLEKLVGSELTALGGRQRAFDCRRIAASFPDTGPMIFDRPSRLICGLASAPSESLFACVPLPPNVSRFAA